jgi:hypothetical protein
VTIPQLRSQAATHSKHAKSCKKQLDSCDQCKSIVAWYRELSPLVLSQVLEDRGKPVRG